MHKALLHAMDTYEYCSYYMYRIKNHKKLAFFLTFLNQKTELRNGRIFYQVFYIKSQYKIKLNRDLFFLIPLEAAI